MRKPRGIRPWHVLVAWLVIYFPWLPGWPLRMWLPEVPFRFVADANLAAEYALIAISLVILTGWVGQISLGQGAFVGIGAFATGLISRTWGIPFPLSLPIVAVLTAGVAALLGLVALRVRGLYLAVATLIFAWMADAYLFSASWFVGEGGASSLPNRVIGHPDSITVFDFSQKRTLYLVMVAAVAAVCYLAVNLRDSKTGRAFFAIRGSEMAAVSLGVDVMRYKLLAFALSGALAGIAGNLMMVDLRTATPVTFQFTVSLFFLGIAVVGGISSLGGAVAAGVLFAGLEEVFALSLFQGWRDIVAIALLLGVLLGYPGGLGAIGQALKARLGPRLSRFRARFRGEFTRLRRRSTGIVTDHDGGDEGSGPGKGTVDEAERSADGGVEATTGDGRRPNRTWPWRRHSRIRRPRHRAIALEEVATERLPTPEQLEAIEARVREENDWRTGNFDDVALPENRADRTPVLEAEDITVRFGGLVAADDVSLAVREREIVGLIGPNGAGKTTTFNAVAGLNDPADGHVRLFGDDVTDLPVHVRAAMGMGRTFQLVQLFPQLSVFDNLLVATHVRNATGVFSHLALTGRAVLAEAQARDRVRLVVDLLGLHDVAERQVAGLPFGVLRQVEIARALVTASPLMMLDEPASGLDNTETDELMQLLRYLRGELGVSILLIEHDVRMVTAVSDYIYVLNQGRILAEGTPSEIQANPDVVAAYLGEEDDEDPAEVEPVGAAT